MNENVKRWLKNENFENWLRQVHVDMYVGSKNGASQEQIDNTVAELVAEVAKRLKVTRV